MPNQKEIHEKLMRDFLAGGSAVTYLGAGSVVGAVLKAVSYELSVEWYELDKLKRSIFLATAYSDDLDVLGNERGIARETDSAAGVVLSFSGPDGTLIPAGTIVDSGTGVSFTTAANVTIGSPFDGTITVPADTSYSYSLASKVYATAGSTGTIGNLPAHSITTINPAIAGVTCTNHYPSENGLDNESDTHYRARITRYASSLDRTTADFYKAKATACTTIVAPSTVAIGDKILRVNPLRQAPNVVRVIIVTKDGSGLSAAELTALDTWLQTYCPVLTTVNSENVVFTPIDIRITIEPVAGITDADEAFVAIAKSLSDLIDWSVWKWGLIVDDADLLAAANVEDVVANLYFSDEFPFYTHLVGATPTPGDVSVANYSLPRLTHLEITAPSLIAPDDEAASDVDTDMSAEL